MSLYEFLRKKSYSSIVSTLGETMPKIETYLMYTSCDDTFEMLYKKYNNYSLELTVSPKSTPRHLQVGCCACGANTLKDVDQQVDIMMQLINNIIIRYKINILGTVELYKDKKNIHIHAIMNNHKPNKLKHIKKYIKDYYELGGPCVNLSPIRNRVKYCEYLTKEPYTEYFYFDLNNEKTIEKLEEESQNNIKRNKCECQITECKYCKNNNIKEI